MVLMKLQRIFVFLKYDTNGYFFYTFIGVTVLLAIEYQIQRNCPLGWTHLYVM